MKVHFSEFARRRGMTMATIGTGGLYFAINLMTKQDKIRTGRAVIHFRVPDLFKKQIGTYLAAAPEEVKTTMIAALTLIADRTLIRNQ